MCTVGVGVAAPAPADTARLRGRTANKVKCPTRVDAGVKGQRVQPLGALDLEESFVETGQTQQIRGVRAMRFSIVRIQSKGPLELFLAGQSSPNRRRI